MTQHDGATRVPSRDSLAYHLKGLKARADMDPELRDHLERRVRRAMRLYRDNRLRDFALAVELLYEVTVDSSVPRRERRSAVPSWMSGMRDLELMSKRLNGTRGGGGPRGSGLHAQPTRPKAADPESDEASEAEEGDGDDAAA